MSKEQKQIITILGAGSWGLTLSWLFSQSANEIVLYTGNKEKLEQLNKHRGLEKPVAVNFSQPNISFTSDLAQALQKANVIIFCCTSQSMRSLAKQVSPYLKKQNNKAILVSAVKGLELETLQKMSEILEQEIPGFEICVLSGPNLAKEISQGLPTATVIASKNPNSASAVQKYLSVPKFRLYTNTDVIGVELGGTLKNVIAIAAGCADGLNLGANAKAALITRGLAEISRLAVFLGAKPTTLAGLAGMGDLLATCASPLSRNYHLGLEMAKGKSLQSILKETGAVIEGITTTTAVCKLSQNLNIELPIAKLVQEFLDGSLPASEAIMTLMNRPLVSE
jgi:glycerol-3-phosphate dehydrogenase (NAD(P)+)